MSDDVRMRWLFSTFTVEIAVCKHNRLLVRSVWQLGFDSIQSHGETPTIFKPVYQLKPGRLQCSRGNRPGAFFQESALQLRRRFLHWMETLKIIAHRRVSDVGQNGHVS